MSKIVLVEIPMWVLLNNSSEKTFISIKINSKIKIILVIKVYEMDIFLVIKTIKAF